MQIIRNICVKEESGTDKPLIEEVGGECRDPIKERESGSRLEHEQRNRLLEEQPDDDSRPWDLATIPRSRPEAELEDEQSDD